MAGSVRRKRDGWEVRVYTGRDPVTGTSRTVSRFVPGVNPETGEKNTKRDADRRCAELVLELDETRPVAGRHSVADLVVAWQESVGADLEAKTRATERSILNRLFLPRFGAKQVRAVTAEDLDALYAGLRRRYSVGYVRRLHGVLHRLFDAAVRWKWIAANPAAGTRRMKGGHSVETEPPSPLDIGRLLGIVEGELRVWLQFLVVTGCRPGEACALRWRDINPEAGVVLIAGSITTAGRTMKTTKTGKGRKVAIDPDTAALLAEHRATVAEATAYLGGDLNPDGFVFADGNGRPWRPDSTSRRLRVISERAGIEGLTLRGIRHSAATALMAQGVDARNAAGRLGHSEAVLKGVYAHRVEAVDVHAAGLMAATFLPPKALMPGPTGTGSVDAPIADEEYVRRVVGGLTEEQVVSLRQLLDAL